MTEPTDIDRSEPIVDSHHHLWDLFALHYPWSKAPPHDVGWGDTRPLYADYLVGHLRHDAERQNLIKSVHVQANVDPTDPVRETEWLERVADLPDSAGLPTAIVAYVDLSSSAAAEHLARHAAHPRVRGIRQVLNRHADVRLNRAPADFLADPRWQAQFGLLRNHGLSFDAQVYWQQMPALAGLARRHPDIPIVLDHAGMPVERDEAALAGWAQGMRLLATCPNVCVKLSGYGMSDLHWTPDSLRRFVRDPIEWFGPDRAMFGSNFPVDRLMSSYDRLWDTYRLLVADLSSQERRALLRGTAERFYRI